MLRMYDSRGSPYEKPSYQSGGSLQATPPVRHKRMLIDTWLRREVKACDDGTSHWGYLVPPTLGIKQKYFRLSLVSRALCRCTHCQNFPSKYSGACKALARRSNVKIPTIVDVDRQFIEIASQLARPQGKSYLLCSAIRGVRLMSVSQLDRYVLLHESPDMDAKARLAVQTSSS
ncbi:hypothetical protein FA13DRAFT_1772610 [Coprinellus micaceus]|uniref:Uncharacterized protein n=1 Tax=Coprinellus micaceus TaxID=71717 RepID=A0A4Y7TIP1_COPMI|nr:hypothetical protein FA13DRAFT_1772610 [Coprinellus micaceus]